MRRAEQPAGESGFSDLSLRIIAGTCLIVSVTSLVFAERRIVGTLVAALFAAAPTLTPMSPASMIRDLLPTQSDQ